MSVLAASSSSPRALELLSPGGLWLLLLLVPLVVLYILKIQRRRRTVASTWLWATAQRDLLARAPWKRLVAQVPLFVQALVLALLAAALARPATRGQAFTGDHVAIVLDTSASMSARAAGADGAETTRLDLAKRAAVDLLSALSPGSDAMVLEAARDARVLSPLDRDLARVKAAVDRAAAGDVEGDLGQAVALAVDRLRPLGGARRLVVLTDGDLARPAALDGASIPVEVITVGEPVDNAAIVRVDVRSGQRSGPGGLGGRSPPSSTGAEEVQAFLIVANFGARPRDLYVTMREENASDVLASRRVVVKPGERLPVPLDFLPTRGDYDKGLLFEISPHDAMPADDVAYGRVPAGDRLPVFLAGDSPWVKRALGADPRVDLRSGTVAELETAGIGRDAFVVVAGACPASPPGGDLLVLHPPPGRCLGAEVGPAVDHPDITSWEVGDPRMRFLSLDGVHVARAARIDPEGASRRLVNGRDGTLVADVSTGARTATLVGFDPGESDWALKASFVLFVRNLLELARAHRAQGVAGPARTGEPLRVNVPPSATHLEATGPGDTPIEVSQRGGLVVLPETSRAGFYRVRWQGPQAGAALVAANLASAAESDLSHRTVTVREGKVSVAAAPTEPHREHAWLLALLALGLVVFDVWYLTRDPRAASPVASPAVAHPRMPERLPRSRA